MGGPLNGYFYTAVTVGGVPGYLFESFVKTGPGSDTTWRIQ